MEKHYKNTLIFLLLCFINISCTEQYVLQSNNYDEALVVEATITNEFKHQEIKISRTFRFEDNGPKLEVGAQVYINDNNNNIYRFEENNGKYISTTEFQAEQGNVYRLTIMTNDGKTYESSSETLTPVNEMQSVLPIVETINKKRGVAIVVSSFDPNNTSKYYRYEYEETYKIIAPNWDDEKTILAPYEPGDLHQGILIIPRVGETQTCYSTKISDEIILTTTNGLSEDRIDYVLRFLDSDNPIISHRYSILVRQYIQNLASFTYYKTLKELSSSESILSPNQPGFFYGNLKSVENPNEKIIGFFEVSSISSKRIFFNYVDLFPGEPLPPYFTDCKVREFKNCFLQSDPECRGAVLNSIIGSNSLVYVDSDFSQTYFFMVSPPCGDCTKISSNIKPSFWID